MRHFSTFLKWLYNRLVPALLLGFSLLAFWYLGQRLEIPFYDWLSRIAARPASASPVTLVLIDDASIQHLQKRFGAMPWSRQTYLEVFRAVSSAKPSLMVLDAHFINLDQPLNQQRRQSQTDFPEQVLFEEMRRFPHLITGLAMSESTDSMLNPDFSAYYSLNLGVVSIPQDHDGKIRALKAVYTVQTGTARSGIFPALSLATAREYLNLKTPGANRIMDVQAHSVPPRLLLYPENQPRQGISLAMRDHTSFYVRWKSILNLTDGSEYHRSHPAIPLWRFFEPDETPPDLTGRIALIGSSATFHRDYHATPVTHRHLGPDIHATAIDNILQEEAVEKAHPLLNLLILLGMAALAVALRLRSRDFGRLALYMLGSMIIYCSIVVGLFAQAAFWLDLATPELFFVIAFLAGSTFSIMTRDKQLAAMEKSLSQLVDPRIFREIRRRAHVLQPGGQKLDISSMFIDIRNFTTMAEQLPPGEVTEILNEFYAEVVQAVFRHQGTIDKFMGDGILVIFGAPLPDPSHRQKALLAALDILEITGELTLRWQNSRGIETEIGISLHSGPAFVGFLGPPDKLEYTAVGDTVNTCVRLQDAAKKFQTRLIFSAETLTNVEIITPDGNGVIPGALEELGSIAVRGRKATVQVYTLSHAR